MNRDAEGYKARKLLERAAVRVRLQLRHLRLERCCGKDRDRVNVSPETLGFAVCR
jgi:translation initiation factor IF-1